ncbi:hypothetical protein [Acinetobacter soli]|uniref:hypothetical protein n=1 Tax=Acinetobacter soli TaxID=487316 RepID=UPI001D17E9B5|nr:hypothetical protein [Acinetobacter soli]
MFLKALVSSISKITHDLGNAVTSQSSASSEGSLNLSLSLSTTVTAVASSISTLPTTISSVVTSLPTAPTSVVSDLLGTVTGGTSGNPLETVTNLLGGLAGGGSGNPLGTLTGALSSVTAPLQTGIDVLQGVESLKTDIITSTIDTLASSGINILPQAAEQISALAGLGTLTFETSESTVNGVLDAVSGVLDLNPTAVSDALTGVAATLAQVPRRFYPASQVDLTAIHLSL